MSKQQIQALLGVLCAIDAFTEQATLTVLEDDCIRALQNELTKRI